MDVQLFLDTVETAHSSSMSARFLAVDSFIGKTRRKLN